MINHLTQILNLLRYQIANNEEVDDIRQTAEKVSSQWVPPLEGGAASTNGLIYGLVQSGKTGVLTVTGAIGADEGYRAILILTSDNDALYSQTLMRVREAFPGIDILGKADFKDAEAFTRRVKGGTTAMVATKNASILKSLIQNFKIGKVKGLTCLIIDDEADQASLNTRARKDDGTRSKINELIEELRGFFQRNTYIQVTATPQALFLQAPAHAFRPKFTVLSNPGASYVGGDDFFGEGSELVREFDIADLAILSPGHQPRPVEEIPKSLLKALDTFMVAATIKRIAQPDQKCAFLCHVSTKVDDHRHIERLLQKYKFDLPSGLKKEHPGTVARLRNAYDDLTSTYKPLPEASFAKICEDIQFFSPGITVKLVNGQTDEDVALQSPYNLFVGGNKLGRGVTIANLLASYYGRNPGKPQADTVLQHARMYGYRRKDIGLLRLFLPAELHRVFRAIHKMETGLRELIRKNEGEEFRGVYVEDSIAATRRNVLVPGALGVYSAGATYNPALVRRDKDIAPAMDKITKRVEHIQSKSYVEVSLDEIREIIKLTVADESASERVWDPIAMAGTIEKYAGITKKTTGYLYVARNRNLNAVRRETQGVLDGGEANLVPNDKLTLFLLHTEASGRLHGAWWPQVRFPQGRFAFAFAI